MSYTDFSVKDQDANAKNPKSVFASAAQVGTRSILGKTLGPFVGEVWLNPILQTENLAVANVNFAPCARTNWHKHEGGQLLKVIAGSGWVCDKGGKPRRITLGDTIWCPPGGVHWHGADDETFMAHEAISHGRIDWYSAVTEEEYAAKK